MKSLITVAFLSMISLSVFAQVPKELKDLIPVGQSSLRLNGLTKDQKHCIVELSSDPYSYGISLSTLNEQGGVDSRRTGKFQIGFGYKLQSVDAQNEVVIAISTRAAESGYDHDIRATANVNNSGGHIGQVQIIEEEKEFLRFKTNVNETCSF